MSFVLDASVALSWCFEDGTNEYADRVLEALKEAEAIVPQLWALEVAQGLLVAERRRRIDAAKADGFIRMLLALPIAVDPGSRSGPLREVWQLARARHLSVYDAAYLDLAVRHALPLATRDERLGTAAHSEGVGRFRPPR